MKKQINPTIKAYLIRGAFYLLLLIAVCAIPFALAQRNAPKRSGPNAGKLSASQSKAGSLLLPYAAWPVARVPNLSSWSIVANYPLVSESVSVSSDGTFAYGVGGFAGGFPSNAFNVYDPVADTWSPLSNIPGAFYDAPSVYAANTNSIYVFGGIDANFNPSNVLQIYNVGTGIWTTGAPMPGARYFAGAAYYSANGKIYVISGFDQNFTETSTTWQYDPVANAWDTTRANMPAPTGGAGYSIVGQNIYLAGTWNNAQGSTQHYRYDIVADSWTSVAPVPVNIYRPDSAAIGTNTYLVGGGNPFLGSRGFKGPKVLHPSTRSPETSYNSTYIYDTLSDSWSTGPNTNVAHSFTGGTAIGNTLIVVTGFDGITGDTNVVEAATEGGGGTPSPTPSCTPIVINGSITNTDPSHTDKLANSNNPQTCGGTETCATSGDPTSFRYDAYTFTNTGGAACVTIDTNTACNADHAIFTSAYLGSFDPNNLCTNWVGDSGFPPDPDQAFQVEVPGGQTLVVVVNEEHHAGCPGYTLTITGFCPGITPTPTPTASPSCTPGGFSVLIAYADGEVQPDTLRNDLLAAGASVVDFFDAQLGTPTLGQLQQYQIVVPFSNFGYADPVTLGNNLDAYQAAGGVVVAFNFDWFGGSQSIGGAWIANDSPFNDNATTNFSSGTLGTCTFGPLCNGVTTLDAFFREITTLASGATLAATWNDGSPLIAYKGRAVGVSAYVGDFAGMWSGDFAKVIINSGTFLLPCGSPTPTATATAPSATPTSTATATATAPSATPTLTATATATATAPSATPTGTATATATATATHTPRATPTPRPAPTPVERTGNCYFFNSTCTGLPQLVNMTCIDCIVAHSGGSWEDGAGCMTTCPMR